MTPFSSQPLGPSASKPLADQNPANRLGQAAASAAATEAEAEQLKYASDSKPNVDPAGVKLDLGEINTNLPVEERGNEALRLAVLAFPQTGSWVVFYRTMLGVDGVCRKLFPTADELRYFETTEQFIELNEMVAAMRSEDKAKGNTAEPERMITIRIPKSLHDVLKAESDEQNLSINKLCISKLLQRLHPKFAPIQKGKRRGRRPGPQGPRRKVVQGTPAQSTAPTPSPLSGGSNFPGQNHFGGNGQFGG